MADERGTLARVPHSFHAEIEPIPVDRESSKARWVCVIISALLVAILLMYAGPAITDGTIGTDANGNALAPIFWCLFSQFFILPTIGFGTAIALTLMDVRANLHSTKSESAEVKRDRENKAVARVYSSSKALVLLYALSATALFAGSVAGLFVRATWLFNCVGTKCYTGVYLRVLYLFFGLDVISAVLSGFALGFGFWFWYILSSRKGSHGTARPHFKHNRDEIELESASVKRASGAAGAAAPVPMIPARSQYAMPLTMQTSASVAPAPALQPNATVRFNLPYLTPQSDKLL